MNHPENLSLIAAMDDNALIGDGLRLPWPKLTEDFRRFKRATTGRDMIMGRTTFDSLPSILPGRRHIVLSSHEGRSSEQVLYAQSIDEALDIANEGAFVIGGALVYEQLEPRCSIMYITRVNGSYEGDTFFPNINWVDWKRGVSETYRGDIVPMTFEKYFR